MNNSVFVSPATTMMVVWRMDSTLFDQRRQRSSAASAAQQSPNSQQLPIGSPEFPRGLEIERPLKPLNALKPLMNNNFFVAAATTMVVVWRMDSTLFDQRRQRSSAASAAQ